MTKPAYTQLKGTTVFGKDSLTHNLLYGIIDFYNWGFLEIGGYSNVNRPTSSGVYGGSRYRLRYVNDPRYSAGQVWEGFRTNWVWETGVSPTTQPIQVSGVWKNNTYSTLNSLNAYVDYPNGRVIFNTPIATTSTIDAEFSHRIVAIRDTETPYLQTLMYESYRVDKPDALTSLSGNWSSLADTRTQLPCVGVEVSYDGSFSPYQIAGGQNVHKTVNFYIFAENRDHKDYIADIIASQNDRGIIIPDRFQMRTDPKYPLNVDFKGAVTGVYKLQYPEIVAWSGDGGFAWRTAYITNTRVQDLQPINGWLHRAKVSSTYTIVAEEI
jgi:hypothetical protein